jgi:hypothetical protein
MAYAESKKESDGDEMKRSSLAAIALLVLLGIATFFVLQRPGEKSTSGPSEKTLVQYDSTAVDKIEVKSAGGTVTIEKQGGKWMLTSPVRYVADENAVASAVGQGKSIKLNSLVSTNPEKQKIFQVDSTATLVRVYENGTERGTFRVGKPGSTYTETYVRLEGSNDVYLAEGMLGTTFSKQPKGWRDKTIFKMDEGSIRIVKMQFGDTTFTLTFQDSSWHIGKDSTLQQNVKSFLTTLSNFQADDFIDSAITAPPKLIAMIEVEGTQLRFYFNKDASKYFVQSSRSPQWFEIQSWRATQILKRKKDFVPAGK